MRAGRITEWVVKGWVLKNMFVEHKEKSPPVLRIYKVQKWKVYSIIFLSYKVTDFSNLKGTFKILQRNKKKNIKRSGFKDPSHNNMKSLKCTQITEIYLSNKELFYFLKILKRLSFRTISFNIILIFLFKKNHIHFWEPDENVSPLFRKV